MRLILKQAFFGFFLGVVILISCTSFCQNDSKIDSLTLSLNFSEDEAEKASIQILLAEELKRNNPDLALDYAKKALNSSEHLSYHAGIVRSSNIIAEIYWSKSDFKNALEWATSAKLLAEKYQFQNELAQSFRLLGINYVDLGDYKKASENFFSSLRIFEQINDKVGIAKAMSSIGYVYFDQENYEKALEYYFQSLNLAKETNDKLGIARGLNNIAAVYGNDKKFEKAREYILQAIDINKEMGNSLWVGINYMNLGLTNQELENIDESLIYYQQAFDMFESLNNHLWQAKCLINMGSYYVFIKDYHQAEVSAQLALEIAEHNQMKKVELDAYELLRDVSLVQTDTIGAYNYTSLIIEAKDSLNVEKNKALLSKLELQYQFEKREQEELIQKQRSAFIMIIIIISLVFAFVIVLLLWARQRIKSRNAELEKKSLEEQLEHKSKEFTLHVMSLMKKNEIISDMTGKLLQIAETAAKEDTRSAIKKIAIELQKSTDVEIWEEFELRFSQVHKGFYARLLEKYPDLTPSEQKLCAFLRLNITTKDISELTGQSVSTLETARYRLRKKLKLVNSQINLVTFLSQI